MIAIDSMAHVTEFEVSNVTRLQHLANRDIPFITIFVFPSVIYPRS